MQYFVPFLVLQSTCRERGRELVSLLLLSSRFHVNVSALWLFLTMPWAGLQCVIMAFPGHTHFLSVKEVSYKGTALYFNSHLRIESYFSAIH